MISVKNLVKRYGDLVALNHFDLDVAKGEIFGLLGPNGSGKTTAINCMLSLLKYSKGEVSLFGEPMTHTNYRIRTLLRKRPDRAGCVTKQMNRPPACSTGCIVVIYPKTNKSRADEKIT